MGDDDKGIIKLGPAGAEKGKRWDEKGHTEIVQIFISYDTYKVCSIQFQYMKNGNLVLSEHHGRLSRDNFDTINLNYPEEYVTSISGRVENGIFSSSISSLSITTNLRTYGPFGQKDDTECELRLRKNVCGNQVEYTLSKQKDYAKRFHYGVGKHHQFGGFYGYGDESVISIGVYCKPITTLNPVKPIDILSFLSA